MSSVMNGLDRRGGLTASDIYACPSCKGKLVAAVSALHCLPCDRTYPVRGEIPDFILGDLSQSSNPVLHKAKSIDRLARIYETKLWYPLVLNLAAGWGRTSLARLITLVQQMVGQVRGPVLDVACGPGTFGRPVAAPSRNVFAIDLSQGMLERGMGYARREHVTDIHFARALVEALPFGGGVFHAAICCGSLHLFEDPVLALREIGRTLKAGASVAILTFTAGNSGILRFSTILRHANKNGLRVFELRELGQMLAEAGFENYQPTTYGSVLAARAFKSER
ncbi:MAG TPA: methyltransferase domain-containing protein [Candidatus Acidoferrum sp.]|nr:methyltransferase domain-containing protein [Candidatus Acidoferrum sp.]